MVEREKNESSVSSFAPSAGAARVVHLTTVHHPFDPRIFHKQLRSLSEEGFDTHLIAPHSQTEHTNGVTIHSLPHPKNRTQRLALQVQLFRKARSLGAALYQLHDPELIPLAVLLGRRTEARIVYDMHEDYRTKGAVLGRGLRALERWGFGEVDHVLFAEESYRSILGGWDVERTHIANYFKPVGPATSASTAEGGERASRQPTRLLYTGTIARKRGLGTMLDLASKIQRQRRPETVTIVGVCHRSKQRTAAETRIQDQGLSSVVTRVGWDTYVLPSSMPPHYRQADVGLALCEPHPNLVGSLLTKFYEYLHYGLPIICSDFPLWRRFIEENDCGAVVPPGDAEAVLDVLARWRERPEVYRAYSQNARAAADQYRWDEMGQRLVQVYRNLLCTADEPAD